MLQKEKFPFVAHANLIRACQNVEQQLPCAVAYRHMGHQNKGYPMVSSRAAWLYIKADLAVKNQIDPLHKAKLTIS